MKLDKGTKSQIANVLVGCALVGVVLSGFGYLGLNIWLASTQWLLVSAVLVLFAIYLKLV